MPLQSSYETVLEPVEEEKKESQNLLFTFVDTINYTKNNMLRSDDYDPQTMEKEYKRVSFIVNRGLSMHHDTIFQAQEMNMRPSLDGLPQYDYYLGAISKKKRFPPKGSKWFTKMSADNMELVMEYQDCSKKKALKILDILTDEDIQVMKATLNKGGVIKRGKKVKDGK